jgi:uncharacterized repeat protein (TIGR03833 family)
VSIVLKADQPTGDETQGVVQDVLTSGNHPRGIKVRLRDGRVGRVQRMMPEGAVAAASATAGSPAAASTRFTQRYTDVRNDEYPEEPPPRSFADFLPPDPDGNTAQSPAASANGEASVRCPICDAFEGDEAAVTYHIEQKHLGEGA